MIANTEIERARAVKIQDEIERRGLNLKRQGSELVGPCPVCGGTDRFAVNIRKRIWYCRKCGVGGDVITLVQHLDGRGFKDAITVLAGDGVRTKTTARQKTGKRQDDQNNSPKAAWLWSQRKPITEGTPPWLYLRKRGYTGPIPATLGYLSARDPHPAAMIAAFGTTDEPEPGIITPPKTIVGVHLTRLTADGEKAPNAAGKTRIMLGVCKGAPITISPPNDLLGMAVTEGIEDALSVYQATGLGVWAAGAAGFMPALAPLIPAYIETITIYAHDDNGRSHAIDLARAITARGIEVLMQGL
jgi:putative DNA primase/helicase